MPKYNEQLLRMYIIYRSIKNEASRMLTIEDIIERVENELSMRDLPARTSPATIKRDIAGLRHFGVDIKHNRSARHYTIVQDKPESLDLERLIEPIELLTALDMDAGLPAFVFPEKYDNRGLKHLNTIIRAIRQKRDISFSYYKYQDEKNQERKLFPEVLKEWRGRWYVLGFADGLRRVFALDRIETLKIEQRASHAQTDTALYKQLFENSYGIYPAGNYEVERLVLTFDKEDGLYLKSRPLHSSQRVINEGDNFVTLELRLCITPDLKMELFSRTWSIRVEEPLWLRNEMRSKWQEALDRNQD